MLQRHFLPGDMFVRLQRSITNFAAIINRKLHRLSQKLTSKQLFCKFSFSDLINLRMYGFITIEILKNSSVPEIFKVFQIQLFQA